MLDVVHFILKAELNGALPSIHVLLAQASPRSSGDPQGTILSPIAPPY